jgi:tetratricopeptide (TPR) repeat protein
MVFGLFFLLPGYMLSLLLIPGPQLDGLQRLAVSFPLSLGAALLPAILALALRSTLSTMGLLLSFLSLLLYVGVLAFWHPSANVMPAQRPRRLALISVGIVILVLMTASFLSAQYGPIQQDDWGYLSRVRHYLDAANLNPMDPYRGTGVETLSPRQYYDTSLPWMAFLSEASSLAADQIWWYYLRVTLTGLSVVSFYALARELLGSSVHAALACALLTLFLLSDASRMDGTGGMLLFRMPQDKIIGWAIFLPVVSFALIRFLETGAKRYWAVFALTVLPASNFSETIFVQIGILVVAFVVVRMLLGHRAKSDWLSYALIGVVLASSLILPIIGRLYASTLTTSAFDRSVDVLQEQLNNRLLFLSRVMYIADPQLLSSTITKLALVLSPLLLLYIAGNIGAQFLVAATGGVVLTALNPLVAPLLGKLTYPGFVWRVVWLIPSILIITFFVARLSALVSKADIGKLTRFLLAALGVFTLVLVLLSPLKASAADITEFSDPTHQRTLYSRTDQGIVRHPIRDAHSFLQNVRMSTQARGTFLIHPHWSVMATALIPEAHIVAVTGQSVGSEQLAFPDETRYQDALSFFALDRITSLEDTLTLSKYGVDYVIVDSTSTLADSMSRIPSLFELAYADSAYALYQIHLENLESLGGRALVEGDILLQTKNWAEAEHSFQTALSEHTPGAHAGMGRFYLEQQSLDEAAQEFQYELEQRSDDATALLGLAGTYYRQWQTERALATLERTLQTEGNALDQVFMRAKLSERLGEPAERYWHQYLELVKQAGRPIPADALDLAKRRLQSTLVIDLASELETATLKSSLEPMEAIQPEVISIGGLELDAIFMHPTSSAAYSLSLPSGDVWLDWYLALVPEAAALGQGDGVQFDLYLERDGTRYLVFSEYIDPKNLDNQRRWLHRDLNLSMWAGQTITLTFATDPGPNGDVRYDWAAWGEPRIVTYDPSNSP